jgi:uncharacterized membrane protein YqhA
MAELQSARGWISNAERLLERVIFGSRWLLAPLYLDLVASLWWLVGIHTTFVVSGLLLALMDRVSEKDSH